MTFRSAQTVVTSNESHRAIALARGGKRPDEVFVVRSGPDLSRFQMEERRPEEWANGRRFVVAYLGEICKQDGVDHLVRAMKILRDELGRDDVQCVLMGGGPHQPAIAHYAEQIGVGDCCTFLGRVSDATICRALSSADVGVDPDPKTTWSDKSTMNKVLEYMFFGLPVLAYDLHETRVSAGEAGRYVEANSVQALARGIGALLDDSAARARMGAAGAARVRNSLAWSFSVPPLLAAYGHAFGLLRKGALPPVAASPGAEPSRVA
jgi:glycosyltransferase involved in cell wall biosynthesis